MLIKQHPQYLEDLLPIHLTNYQLTFGYAIGHLWERGGVYSMYARLGDRSILYCVTKACAERVRLLANFPEWYSIEQIHFLRYMHPEDPHAFSLDRLHYEEDFCVERVRLYTDEEVDRFIASNEIRLQDPQEYERQSLCARRKAAHGNNAL